MAYAYQKAIATEIAERMEGITTGNGYAVETPQVIRHELGGSEDYKHGTIQVRCGDVQRDSAFLGQYPEVRWRQDFYIAVTVRPPPVSESASEDDAEPIDDEIAKWMHAVALALNCEDQLGEIVDEIHIESFGPVVGSDSEYAGVVAQVSAAYRTRENDLSTSPTAASESGD